MDLGIKGKVALVTGSSSGIGWETARVLLEEGATVILTGKKKEKLEQAAAKLGTNDNLFHYAADITSSQELKAMHDKITEEVGKIDILVQSAGITGAQGLFHEIDMAGWESTLEVDLLGPVRVVKEFLPDLREGGWGRLVLIASEDAVQPYDDELPYCCAKAGILAFAKGLSRTYAREGLLVNTVSPAFIETPMTDAMMDKRSKELNVSKDEAIQSFLDKKDLIWNSNAADRQKKWLPSLPSFALIKLLLSTVLIIASTLAPLLLFKKERRKDTCRTNQKMKFNAHNKLTNLMTT